MWVKFNPVVAADSMNIPGFGTEISWLPPLGGSCKVVPANKLLPANAGSHKRREITLIGSSQDRGRWRRQVRCPRTEAPVAVHRWPSESPPPSDLRVYMRWRAR